MASLATRPAVGRLTRTGAVFFALWGVLPWWPWWSR